MWPRRSEPLCIGLSTTQLAWRLQGQAAQTVPMRMAEASGDEIVDEVAGAIAKVADANVRVGGVNFVVGSSVARHWLQAPVPGLRSLAELEGLVGSRAELLFGHATSWIVAADWHATRPFLCAAIPQSVDAIANGLAERFRTSRRLITSLSATLSSNARALRANGWTVLCEPEALHVVHADASRIDLVRTVAVSAGIADDARKESLDRELVRTAALGGGLALSEPKIVHLAEDANASQAMAACQLAGSQRSRVQP